MRRTVIALLTALAALTLPAPARAGCGCNKPPPPLASVRPFVGFRDQIVTLFDSRLVIGNPYQVQFIARDGTNDWSTGRAMLKRDLADGRLRNQLRVKVGKVSFGPCTIYVWDHGTLLYRLTDDLFTVTARPVSLDEIGQTVTNSSYQTGVGADGTMYIAVDVSKVTAPTTFTGNAVGYPLTFSAQNVMMFNKQGFLMQVLDPTTPGLFQILPGDMSSSYRLAYWRHEFATYKQDHRQSDAHQNDDDPDWHADGTYHVDHDTIFVAIFGTLANGTRPVPGSTPTFMLQITSTPSPSSPL